VRTRRPYPTVKSLLTFNRQVALVEYFFDSSAIACRILDVRRLRTIQQPIDKTSGAKPIRTTPTYNNIINGNEERERLADVTPPIIINAIPAVITTAKKTIQKICALFEVILLLILAMDS